MAENVPSENEIRKKMEKLVPTVNLETVTTKQFIKLLSKKMGDVKLSSKKKFIKKTLTEIIDAMEAAKSDESAPSSSSSEEEEVKSKKRVTRKKASASSSRGGKGGGLTAVKEVSDELAAFLGKGKQMARTEVVKCLWEYIKENDLQNPNDRREILLDERLKEVFHADKFTMFSMNKYVSAHVYPFTPVNLTELSEKSKKRKELQKEKAAKRQKTGKKRKSGTQAPWRLSADLASVVGKAILPRPQITQGLWAYIREHGLQNPDDKREILCDELLSKVMGGKSKVTMFSMQKFISPHLLEKVDKSEYHHEDDEEENDDESEVDEDLSDNDSD